MPKRSRLKKKVIRTLYDIPISEINANLKKEWAIIKSGKYSVGGKRYDETLRNIALLRDIKRRKMKK